MRIALVVPQSNYPNPPPCLDLLPQGFAYIAGSLKAAGHEVFGINTNYDLSGQPAKIVLQKQIKNTLSLYQPDIVAIGGMAAEYLFLRDTIALVREMAPDIPIICGGSIMTNDPTSFEVLRPDFAVMDEGEYSIIELLGEIVGTQNYAEVAGIAFWQGEQAIYNKLRSAIADLDVLPFPDYEAANIQDYLDMQNQNDNYFHVRTRQNPRMLPISTGRSCPYRCTFCQYSTVEGSRRKYRGRTMPSVIEEIQHFHELYQFNLLKIYDDLFSVKEDRIREFCQLLKQTNLDIHWNASMRVCDVTPDLLKEMKDAGCIHIGYGFESASDEVLNSMNKKVTQKQILRAIEITEQAKIGVQGNFIYGDPVETVETVEETKQFYYKNCHDLIVHNDYITPFPGSPIFDHCLKTGVIPDKQHYYDTIHLRPRYNMSKMKYLDFQTHIEPTIQNLFNGLKFAKSPRFSEANPEDFKHPYYTNKKLLTVDANCPHCATDISFIFPRPDHDISTETGRYASLAPIRQFCNHCHKRMLISMLPYLNLEDKYLRLSQQVKQFADNGTEVIVGPIVQTPGYYLYDLCEAYDLPLSKLNVHSFLTTVQTMGGNQFKGLSIATVGEIKIQRYSKLPHLVLPTIESDNYIQALMNNGVSLDNIYSLDNIPESEQSVSVAESLAIELM